MATAKFIGHINSRSYHFEKQFDTNMGCCCTTQHTIKYRSFGCVVFYGGSNKVKWNERKQQSLDNMEFGQHRWKCDYTATEPTIFG